MKKGVIFLVLFTLFLISSVTAIQVAYDAVKEEVLPGQSAVYTIHLHNEDPLSVMVTIKSIDLAWTMDHDAEKYVIEPGTTRDVTVTYTPINQKNQPGSYGLNFQASTSQEKQALLLPVTVVGYTDLLSAQLPDVPIDPRRPTILTLDLKNKHSIVLDGLKVQLQSALFDQQQTTDLAAYAQKVLEFPIKLVENQKEGVYDIRVVVTMQDKVVTDQKLPLRVSKYGAVQELVEPKQTVFSYGETVTHTNKGNKVVDDQYEKVFSTLGYRFSTFAPEPTNVLAENGKYTARWVTTLQPGATVTITYRTNYGAPLLYTLLVVGAVILVYTLRKQHVKVRKRVLMLHTEKGGIAIMKVVLAVKNASGSDLAGVMVVDKVPKVLNAPTDFGMRKPEHVKQGPDGIIITWKLPHMRRGEEVTFTYKIAGKMHVLGNVVLPRAQVRGLLGMKKYAGRSQIVTLRERK